MSATRIHLQRNLCVCGFLTLLCALWLVMRGYQGLTGDAQIYAFQALATLRPQLAGDLYLSNISQDQYTVFSPFYAFFIDRLGLEGAARLLTLLFSAWLMTAAWKLAERLCGVEAAWLGTAALLIIPSDYGAAGVFHFSEPFLTARLPAEALTVTALALHFGGRRILAFAFAAGALFVHPLIACPACLVLMGLGRARGAAVLSAAALVVAALALAAAATAGDFSARLFTVMDPDWLNVVRERSQFIFLDLWSFHDWDVNARPLLYLAFIGWVIKDPRVRNLCATAALVAAAGFAVALIAGAMGPVAILLQGQAWRWVWISVVLGTLLLPVAAIAAWRDGPAGVVCALLLIVGGLIFQGSACVAAALVLWRLRTDLSPRFDRALQCTAVALSVTCAMWLLVHSFKVFLPTVGQPNLPTTALRQFFALKVPALLLVLFCWKWLRVDRKAWIPAAVCSALIALCIGAFPGAFAQRRPLQSENEIRQYSPWIDAIPPASTVLVSPARDVGEFVWFTLGRPNYLSVDQSAGVVFSRATALEVERRSNNLLPLMTPNWKIRTALRAAGNSRKEAASHPLTASNLMQACGDPVLGFVISPVILDFDPLPHDQSGPFKGWNLYDCGKVRMHGSLSL